MKILLIKLSYIFLIISFPIFSSANTLSVMTYNIRCGYCENAKDINHWSVRKELVLRLIKEQEPDLIGLQEAEYFQSLDLEQRLGNYHWYGVGRDDGKKTGESTAIFYRKDRIELVNATTFWISETPETPSRGWDATFPRTATVIKFRDRKNGKNFYHINVHLDHLGVVARTQGVQFIISLTQKISIDTPTILTGDFNFTREFSAYQILRNYFSDTHFTSWFNPSGGDQTFNDFGRDSNAHNKIDFIFESKGWPVISHTIINTLYENRYPSDHFPILVEFNVPER